MPGKDAGRQIQYYEGGLEGIKKKLDDPQQGEMFRRMMLGKLKDYKYLTMRHRGYVFVMYGKKAKTKATPKKNIIAAPVEVRKVIKNEIVKKSTGSGPVKYSIKVPERVNFRKSFFAEVTITFDKGWHGYVDNEANKKDGFIPTTVSFEPSIWLKPVGEIKMPKASFKGLAKVYKGTVTFKQEFKIDRNKLREKGAYSKMMEELTMKAKVRYQTCDDNICLPPKSVEEDFKMNAG